MLFPLWHDAGEAPRDFEAVVRTIVSVSPLVEVAAPGLVVFSARGPSRYFGGDESLAAHLHALCTGALADSECGAGCGVGVADSRFAAVAAARLSASRGRPCTIAPAVGQEFLDALPTVTLARFGHLDPEVVGLFVRLGLSTCAAVRALGEEALIDRFGLEGRRAHLLVTGGETAPLSPGPPPSDLAATREFDDAPSTVATVVASARPAVEEALAAVSAHGLQCVRLMMACETDHAERSERVWGEPRGFSVAAACERLAVQLDGWLADPLADPDAPTSGVVRVEVTPLECRESLVVQPLLWGGQQENVERAARAVTMARAVGPGVVASVPRWEGGRDVASAWSLVDATLVDLVDVEESERRVRTGVGAPREWSGAVPAPSPAAIAPVPPAVRVLDEQGNDVVVTGRHEFSSAPATVAIGATAWEVVRAAGPWPVEERWWDPRRRRRMARAQVLVRHARHGVGVLLLGAENRAWVLLGRYD